MVTAAKDKLTGPGKEVRLPDGATNLFNFDIDSSVLKSEHRAALERIVLSAANASPGGLRVVIGGSTDRLGDAGHNLALSNRRIEAVATFLKQRKPGYPWTFEDFGKGVARKLLSALVTRPTPVTSILRQAQDERLSLFAILSKDF